MLCAIFSTFSVISSIAYPDVSKIKPVSADDLHTGLEDDIIKARNNKLKNIDDEFSTMLDKTNRKLYEGLVTRPAESNVLEKQPVVEPVLDAKNVTPKNIKDENKGLVMQKLRSLC